MTNMGVSGEGDAVEQVKIIFIGKFYKKRRVSRDSNEMYLLASNNDVRTCYNHILTNALCHFLSWIIATFISFHLINDRNDE